MYRENKAAKIACIVISAMATTLITLAIIRVLGI